MAKTIEAEFRTKLVERGGKVYIDIPRRFTKKFGGLEGKTVEVTIIPQ